MDRDLEVRIKGHLYEIGTVNDEVLDSLVDRLAAAPPTDRRTTTFESGRLGRILHSRVQELTSRVSSTAMDTTNLTVHD